MPFETGTGIRDTSSYVVSPKWNGGIEPYWWDDNDHLCSGRLDVCVSKGQGL